jgi:hypothetical protein
MNDELSAPREEMRAGFAGMRHEFAAVRREMAAGLAAVRAEMRHELAGVHRRIDSTDEHLRHHGVLLEHLRDDLRQLAEAHVLLDQRVERCRQENDAAHGDILALIRTSYARMDRRVARLEERRLDR